MPEQDCKLSEAVKRLYADLKATYLPHENKDFSVELKNLEKINTLTIVSYIRSTIDIILSQRYDSEKSLTYSPGLRTLSVQQNEDYLRRLEEDLRESQKVPWLNRKIANL